MRRSRLRVRGELVDANAPDIGAAMRSRWVCREGEDTRGRIFHTVPVGIGGHAVVARVQHRHPEKRKHLLETAVGGSVRGGVGEGGWGRLLSPRDKEDGE